MGSLRVQEDVVALLVVDPGDTIASQDQLAAFRNQRQLHTEDYSGVSKPSAPLVE
jgi:hypothetical protein